MPGSIFHTFAGTGRTEARMLHLALPGGTEHLMEEMALVEGGD
jgi:hypothetical protein